MRQQVFQLLSPTFSPHFERSIGHSAILRHNDLRLSSGERKAWHLLGMLLFDEEHLIVS